MKRIWVGLIMVLLFAKLGYSQCVAEIKDVMQDEFRGTIIVETEYILNGTVVQLGRSRYAETSGTNDEIIALAKENIEEHCKNIIRRMSNNAKYLRDQKIKKQKELTLPIIEAIKKDLIGEKKIVIESEDIFKTRKIKVTHDEKNTSTDIIPSL